MAFKGGHSSCQFSHLQYLWDMCPMSVPYDVMLMLLLNVCPLLWLLFARLIPLERGAAHDKIMTRSQISSIGQVLAVVRSTVPLRQARALRYIDVNFRSYRRSIGCTYFCAAEKSC